MKTPTENHVEIVKPATIWLVGHVFTISDAFGDKPVWIDQRHRLTVKPGETGAQAYNRETGQELPNSDRVFEIDL